MYPLDSVYQLSFLCHEIRNPYCSLLGYVEFIHAAATKQLAGAPSMEMEKGRAQSSAPMSNPDSSVAQHQSFRQIHGWCSSILASSRHMLDLLDNVLDLSKLENHKMCLEEQPVNLHQLCEQVQTMLVPTKCAC
jgi:signal transduction histidine kinase